MEIFNLFDIATPPAEGAEAENVISRGAGWRVVRTVSRDAASPEGFWYDQEEDETVIVILGEGVIEFEAETATLRPGNGIFIPKGTRHRVKGTNELCIWLCVYGR